jgi:hypothetical protein
MKKIVGGQVKDPEERFSGSMHIMVRPDVKVELADIPSSQWREFFTLVAAVRKTGRPVYVMTLRPAADDAIYPNIMAVFDTKGLVISSLERVNRKRGAPVSRKS